MEIVWSSGGPVAVLRSRHWMLVVVSQEFLVMEGFHDLGSHNERGTIKISFERRATNTAVEGAQAEGMEKPKEAKLWGGRFEKGITPAVKKFGQSVSYDWKLYKHDLMGSRAHASMLAKQKRAGQLRSALVQLGPNKAADQEKVKDVVNDVTLRSSTWR